MRTAVRSLLQAYEEMDPDAAKKALAMPGIRNLDIEFARMAAKDVPLPEGDDLEAAAAAYGAERALAVDAATAAAKAAAPKVEEASPPPAAAAPEAAESQPPPPQEDEDDEDGLC